MKISINKNIYLQLFSLKEADHFHQSIHNIKDQDEFRLFLQKKYPSLEKTKDTIIDALDNKYFIDGTPDFFIYFQNEICGVFEFAPLQEKSDFVEIGFWLYKEFRRKNIMSLIIPVMIDFAKNKFNCKKVIATTSIHNLASQKLLEKCGFLNTGKIQVFDKGFGKVEKDYEYELVISEEKRK